MKKNGLRKPAPVVGSVEWIEKYANKAWNISSYATHWLNIRRYNIAIIAEHNEPGKWRFRIADPNGQETWSSEKYSRVEEAKWLALESLSRKL